MTLCFIYLANVVQTHEVSFSDFAKHLINLIRIWNFWANLDKCGHFQTTFVFPHKKSRYLIVIPVFVQIFVIYSHQNKSEKVM